MTEAVVPVKRFVLIGKHFEDGEDGKRVLAGEPVYEDRPNLGFIHKRSGNLRFDDEMNAVSIYAGLQIFYDPGKKQYYLLDTEGNRIYADFFNPGIALGVTSVYDSAEEGDE